MENIAKNKWRWSTYDKLMNRSGLCYLTFPVVEGFTNILSTVINMFLLEGSAGRGTCAQTLLPDMGRAVGSQARHCSEGHTALLLSWNSFFVLVRCKGKLFGCFPMQGGCRKTGKGLWTRRKLMLHQWCASKLQFNVGKMLKERGNLIFFFYCL